MNVALEAIKMVLNFFSMLEKRKKLLILFSVVIAVFASVVLIGGASKSPERIALENCNEQFGGCVPLNVTSCGNHLGENMCEFAFRDGSNMIRVIKVSLWWE